MSTEDVVLVATVREEIRTRGPFGGRLGTTEIKNRIEAAQVRMVAHLWDDDDSEVDSENEAEPLKMEVTNTNAKVDSYNGTKSTVVAIPPKVAEGHGSGEHSVSPCALWPENH